VNPTNLFNFKKNWQTSPRQAIQAGKRSVFAKASPDKFTRPAGKPPHSHCPRPTGQESQHTQYMNTALPSNRYISFLTAEHYKRRILIVASSISRLSFLIFSTKFRIAGLNLIFNVP